MTEQDIRFMQTHPVREYCRKTGQLLYAMKDMWQDFTEAEQREMINGGTVWQANVYYIA